MRKEPHPYAKINWEKAKTIFQKPIEKVEKNKEYPLVKDILSVLAAAGGVGLMFAFPGAAVGIASLVLGDTSYSRWGSKKIISQLARQKYVTVKKKEDGSAIVTITRNGMIRALTYRLDSLTIQKPKKWDKKWRLVIFDVPEKYRKVRDMFRERLIQLSLYQLQESVYVSPYPCFDEVEFLRELYGISFTVRYLLVEKIEDDGELKEHFRIA